MITYLDDLSLRDLNVSQPFVSPIGQGLRKLTLINKQRTLFSKGLIKDTNLFLNLVWYISFSINGEIHVTLFFYIILLIVSQ